MKPLNLDNRPCSPISSNCVIWQGPDIPCIKLCTGDTVSDVIFKLATELCAIMDQLNVSNYDLTCLGITACPPEDFQALIQLLITKICELNGITPTEGKASGCPDCVVSVAECLRQLDPTLPATMQLIDYVQMIANKICGILAEIQVINDAINNLVNITNDLQFQIDNLPVYELPKITLTSCSIGSYAIGSQVSLDTLINVFLNDVWCPFYTATGTTADLLSAIAEKCIFDSTLQLSTGTAYGLNPNWIADANYNTVADAINNIWVVLCDVFNYVDGLSSITVEDTNTIDLTYNTVTSVLSADIVDTGWVDLLGFDWYGVNSRTTRPQCRRIGNQIHFRGFLMIPLQDPDRGNIPLEWDYRSIPGINTYSGITTVAPSTTGLGSVILSTGGSVTFNQGLSVIPTSVLPAGQNIDAMYQTNFILAFRSVELLYSGSPPQTWTGMLNTLLKPIITTDKKLVLQLVKDIEIAAPGTDGSQTYGTSVANNLISNVRANDFVPEYRSATSVMASSPNSGNLDTITLPVGPNTQYITNTSLDYSSNMRYPFSCNASSEQEIGGFGWIYLEGMSVFISPCAPQIPTPTPVGVGC